MLKLFSFLFLTLLLSACVPKAEQKTSCKAGEVFSDSNRRCIASLDAVTPSPIQQIPVVQPTGVSYSVTPSEDTLFTATLAYTDANFDLALGCGIAATSNINLQAACSCTAGVCTATFLGNANYFGAASFSYFVIDDDGQSLTGAVNLILTSSNDAPTVSAFAAPAFNEDVMTSINLPYVDLDGDIATSCSITHPVFPAATKLFFPMGCSCIAGTCSAFVQSITNLNGASSFTYNVTANGQTSSSALVSVTVNAVNDAPVGTTSTAGTTEDTATTVTLLYTDVESDLGISCSVFNEVNLSESTACACAAGVCTVGITPNANLNSNASSFSFDYTITDSGGAISGAKNVAVTVTSVDDTPVANVAVFSMTPAAPSEDNTVDITLSYSDVDLDLATDCSISLEGNGTAGPCLCSGSSYPNTCTFTFTPAANVNGVNAASFSYNITTTGSSTPSANQGIAFSITAVNDAPTISTIADVADNEASTIVINNIILDEGGGPDENAQTLSVAVTSDNPTLISNAQIAVSFLEAGDASNSPMSLTLNPSAMQNGTANITVTVTDSLGAITAETFALVINSASYLHNGWKNLKALGTKTNHTGAVLENPSVTLQWEDFTAQGTASLQGFKVFRSTTPGGQDFNSPLPCNNTINSCLDATTVMSSTDTFIDALPSNVASGTTYYYVVRPYDSNGIATVTTEVYSEIEVPIPNTNMALVHRWIANKEVCTKMNATVDPNNNFRCTYDGPGSNSGYYDFGHKYETVASQSGHLFVDRFESGCNYSIGPTCTSNGCIGNGSPNINGCSGAACTAAVNSIFYDRTSGACFYKNNSLVGTPWTPSSCVYTKGAGNCTNKGCIGDGSPATTGCNGSACTATAHSFFFDKQSGSCYYTSNGSAWSAFTPTLPIATNTAVAHLPPLIYTSRRQAQNHCTGQNKRLMTRKEFIASSAWASDLTGADIINRENGLTMATNNYCNTMSATGLTYSAGQVPNTGNEDTLPANSSSTLKTVRTGSQVTSACTSRYGIQDLVGNVREWNLDLFQNCYSGAHSTGVKATRILNGIRYTAKRYGLAGNFIRLVPTTTALPGAEVLSVTQDNSFIYININAPTSMTAAQLANLLATNADINALVSYEVLTPSQPHAFSVPTSLAGGNNGGASPVAGYSSQATINTPTFIFSFMGVDYPHYLIINSDVSGIDGNDITIALIDGIADTVEVKNGKNIEVTIDGAGTLADQDTFTNIAARINAHAYAGALVTASTSGVIPASLNMTSFAQISLAGGGKPTCTAVEPEIGIAVPYNGSSYFNDLSSYGYSFNGAPGSGNGPGGGTINIVAWVFGSDIVSYFPSYFHFATGLPTINGVDDAMTIGGDLPAADLNGDQIDVNIDPYTKVNTDIPYGPNRSIASGGGWKGAYDRDAAAQGITGNKAGRYAMDLLPVRAINSGEPTTVLTNYPELADEYTGFRCVTEAP